MKKKCTGTVRVNKTTTRPCRQHASPFPRFNGMCRHHFDQRQNEIALTRLVEINHEMRVISGKATDLVRGVAEIFQQHEIEPENELLATIKKLGDDWLKLEKEQDQIGKSC